MSDRIELGDSGMTIWDNGWIYNSITQTWIGPDGQEQKETPYEFKDETIQY